MLIYIPCHKDFHMAINSITQIRNQDAISRAIANRSRIEVKIAVSVNGTEMTNREKRILMNLTDHLFYVSEMTGGDTNINLGFLLALEKEPTFLWILSVNEFLVEFALSNLFQVINSNPETDVFITNSRNRNSNFEIENIFLEMPDGMATGLISGVIYNCRTMRASFSAGPRYAWTGWGQLAVLQYGAQINGRLRVTELPDSKLYRKPITYIKNSESSSEFEFVRQEYSHSFFGMILLINALFARQTKIRKYAIRSWILSNWYKISYFRIGTQIKYDKKKPQFDSLWVENLALEILRKSGLLTRLILKFAIVLKIEKLRRICWHYT